MLYYNFLNAEGFKERFGIIEHGNGEKSRRNKVLLAFIKQPSLFHEATQTGDYSLINIASMSELKQVMLQRIQESGRNDESLPNEVKLINYTFYSGKYATDEFEGVCQDGDIKCCRYKKPDDGGTYKMKAGKFLQALILETEFGKTLPEQVLVYLMEEFARDFQSYSSSTLVDYKLFVNKEFSRIYSSWACAGDFGSCMVDRGHHSFYSDAVNASAAYLENKDREVVARCIVFNEVFDEDGNVWRLAERQYSRGSDNTLKSALVNALIREKLIDGHKAIGAGCGEATSFEDINGNSLSGKKFHINCDLRCDDVLSYQDSFKWYDIDKGEAFNYPANGADYALDTTDLNLYGDTDDDEEDDEPNEWDSYHQTTVWEVCDVYVHGRRETCDVDNLDDFMEVNGTYYHEDDVCTCDHCGKSYLPEYNHYSELTGQDYCCEDCRVKAEREYMEANWYYSDYDQAFYEDADELTTYLHWDWNVVGYVEKTIARNTLDKLLEQFHLYNGAYYDKINPFTCLPYYVDEAEEVAA